MVLTGYRYNGVAIRAPGGGLAANQSCCCGETPTCCCLSPYTLSGLDVTIGGAITGTGTIELVTDEDHCLRLAGTITMTTTCGGEFVILDVEIYCLSNSLSIDDLRMVVSGSGAGCSLTAGEISPEAGGTCSPLSVTFKVHTAELFPGGCPCGDNQEVTITITAP